MCGEYWIPSREEFINQIYWGYLSSATALGYNIVIDNINLDEKYLKEVEDFVERTNEWLKQSPMDVQYEIKVKDFFHIPLQTCIDRDAQREHPIGAEVIKRTYNKYKDKITPWRYLN